MASFFIWCKNKVVIVVALLFIATPKLYSIENDSTSIISLDSSYIKSFDSSFAKSLDSDYTISLDSSYFSYIDAKVAKHQRISLYDLPYSISTNQPNYRRLGTNTLVLFGADLVALGVLRACATWDSEEIHQMHSFQRWWYHVKHGPHMDNDEAYFNWVLHPYSGAVYYMTARSNGFNLWRSLLYSIGISTIFWEYGVEAFMEIPSIQDMLVTPLLGSAIGECFYLLKRHIVANGYRLFGSPVIGNIVAFIIDPVNEVVGLFAGNECRGNLLTAKPKYEVSFSPWLINSPSQQGFGFSLCTYF